MRWKVATIEVIRAVSREEASFRRVDHFQLTPLAVGTYETHHTFG